MIPSASTVVIGQDVEVVSARDQPSRTYKLDLTRSRVTGYLDEADAMRQAILLILMTERFKYLIYSWNYGVELEGVIGKSFPVVESEIKGAIREALLQDARIDDVLSITVTRTGRREAGISCTALTMFGEVYMEVTIGV